MVEPDRSLPPTTEELVESMRLLPRVDAAELRAEADELFGNEDRISDDNPFERT